MPFMAAECRLFNFWVVGHLSHLDEMQFVLKHRVQCLQWYITLVVSFASYPCNEHKTHVGCPKCKSDTSIVRHVIYTYVPS